MKTSRLLSGFVLVLIFGCHALDKSLADKLGGQSYSIESILVNRVDVTDEIVFQKSIAFYEGGKVILPDVKEPLKNEGYLFGEWSTDSKNAEERLIIDDLVYGFFTGSYKVDFTNDNGNVRPNYISFSSDSIMIVAYKYQVGL